MDKINCFCDFKDRDFERVFIYHLLSSGHFNLLGTNVVEDGSEEKKEIKKDYESHIERDLFSLFISEEKENLVFRGDSECKKNPLFLYKYEPFPEVQKEIMNHFGLRAHGLDRESWGEAKTICFFSLTGGMGTTSMAVSFAQILAREGYKPFYLSLTPVTSWQKLGREVKMKNDFGEFGKLLYSLEKKKDFSLDQFTSEVGGIRTVGSPLVNRYQEEFGLEHLNRLRKAIYEGGFDILVLDAGCNICKRTMDIMESSDNLIHILPPHARTIELEIAEVDKNIKARNRIIRMINQRYEEKDWSFEENLYSCDLMVPYLGVLNSRSIDGDLGDLLRIILGLIEKGDKGGGRNLGGNNRKIN